MLENCTKVSEARSSYGLCFAFMCDMEFIFSLYVNKLSSCVIFSECFDPASTCISLICKYRSTTLYCELQHSRCKALSLDMKIMED